MPVTDSSAAIKINIKEFNDKYDFELKYYFVAFFNRDCFLHLVKGLNI